MEIPVKRIFFCRPCPSALWQNRGWTYSLFSHVEGGQHQLADSGSFFCSHSGLYEVGWNYALGTGCPHTAKLFTAGKYHPYPGIKQQAVNAWFYCFFGRFINIVIFTAPAKLYCRVTNGTWWYTSKLHVISNGDGSGFYISRKGQPEKPEASNSVVPKDWRLPNEKR